MYVDIKRVAYSSWSWFCSFDLGLTQSMKTNRYTESITNRIYHPHSTTKIMTMLVSELGAFDCATLANNLISLLKMFDHVIVGTCKLCAGPLLNWSWKQLLGQQWFRHLFLCWFSSFLEDQLCPKPGLDFKITNWQRQCKERFQNLVQHLRWKHQPFTIFAKSSILFDRVLNTPL